MPHTPGHSPHGGSVYNPSTKKKEQDTGYAKYKSSGSGEQSANPHNNNSNNQTFQSYIDKYNNKVNKNDSNADNSNSKNEGFVSQNNSNVTDGNEVSILDQIADENAENSVFADNLKKAEELQNKNKKKWGLDKYADDNLNGGKIDTSEGVVDEISALYDAAKQMAIILGLDPTKKKDLQKALNFLSGDEWGSQRKLATADNWQQIQDLKNSLGKDEFGNQIKWKTWGTGLRGDARWKGVGPLDKSSYGEALTAMAANVQPGSPAFDYHRALVNSNKPLRGNGGLMEKVLGLFFPTLSNIGKTGIGKWLNEHNEIDKIGVDENGIFNFEYNGAKINVNDGSPFTNTEWQSFLKKENENAGGNYSTYSYDNTNQIEEPIDDIDEIDEDTPEEEYNSSDEYAPWYDFTFFERMFSMSGDTGQKIDLLLGYGPSPDKSYTGVAPRTGYFFAYDKDGNRYEIKDGEREGTINGKTYKFKSSNRLDDEGDEK